MKRTELLRRTPLRARSSLNRVGRIERTPIRRDVTSRLAESGRRLHEARTLVWTRDMGLCVRCAGRGDEFHHRQPRGMGGASRDLEVHDPSNVIVLCRACHCWVESHRALAERDGYLVRRGVESAADVRLLYRGQRAVLSGGGDVFYIGDVV